MTEEEAAHSKELRKLLAEDQTKEAEEAIGAVENLLRSGVARDCRVDWSNLKDHSDYPERKPAKPQPLRTPSEPLRFAFAPRLNWFTDLIPPSAKSAWLRQTSASGPPTPHGRRKRRKRRNLTEGAWTSTSINWPTGKQGRQLGWKNSGNAIRPWTKSRLRTCVVTHVPSRTTVRWYSMPPSTPRNFRRHSS